MLRSRRFLSACVLALSCVWQAQGSGALASPSPDVARVNDDNDRMAGTSPVAHEDDAAPAPSDDKESGDAGGGDSPADAPGTMHADFKEIEPIGLIFDGSDGGLGEDMWIGSDRDFVTARIADAPRITYFATIQDLLRRLYLTGAKPEYFDRGGNRPEPGRDLLTLRLEKLQDMGLYEEAIKMYSQIVDEPYHERLARTGVLSMMQGGKGSLGCLETHTVMDRFGELEFWQTLNAVCDLALSRLADKGRVSDNSPLEINDIDLSASGSKIIDRLSRKHDFVYHVRNQKDIEDLAPMERAALQANNAFVFDRFRFDGTQPVSPAAFGVLLGSRNASESLRFVALAKSASRGYKPLAAVQEQYDLFKNNTREKPTGWRKLATLYREASSLDQGVDPTPMLQTALAMGREYGGPYAITPFADMLVKANPAGFPGAQAADAVRVMIAAGKTIPGEWIRRLASSVSGRKDLLLLLTAELNSDLSTESNLNIPSLNKIFDQLKPREKALIAGLYEILDSGNKLHNYMVPEAYENLVDLTREKDYVMPSDDLTGRLAQAFQEKKLGESILLSSAALQGVSPETVNPGLMQQIVGGFNTVGLTKEARALASDAILGLQ